MTLPIPPNLAALLGMPVQTSNVYAQHGAPVATAQVAVPANTPANTPNAMLSHLQNWKLKQLEAHVQMLRDSNQAIPQPVAMLLAEARRKEEKRTAKRVANRKSACTSRARKKALVEEMTRTNARLKRQAMILALLPDLVIAITIDGEITFCSAQVERVLRHNVRDLIGANLSDLLTPSSRKALNDLVNELVAAERAAFDSAHAAAAPPARQAPFESVSGSSNGAAVVSDQSLPPLSIVKVENQQSGTENSYLSTCNNDIKGAQSASIGSVAPQSESSSERNRSPKGKRKVNKQSSSDDSLSSSSENKNLLKANENLDRNVRWHNEKSKAIKTESCHKDDVTGDAVTANNAGARLSSLQHRPAVLQKNLENLEVNSSTSSSDMMLEGEEEKKGTTDPKNSNGSSSDESGYRESREDTESSEGEELSSGHGLRPKPLAPACNICLIRDDLTTIWCEVTSSIRTRSLKDETSDDFSPSALTVVSPNQAKDSRSSNPGSCDDVDDISKDDVKELLLCLRPIRDGDEKVGEEFRFRALRTTDDAEGGNESYSEEQGSLRGPVKKRPLLQLLSSITTFTTQASTGEAHERESKKMKPMLEENEDDPEKAVAGSLILMRKA